MDIHPGTSIMLAKRLFDVSCALCAIIVTLPLWLLAALAVKIDSPGPVFYKSERVGRNGRRFFLYKFRSMRVGADKTGQVISTDADPRQTRVGRFLRSWKIDELPNFLNVLKGEMSIVGPRPEAPQYVAFFTDLEKRVLNVRPGITDLAVSSKYRDEQGILGRVDDPEEFYRNVILKDYLALNLKYVESSPSLRSDMSIILRTIKSTFWKNRAEIDSIVLHEARRDMGNDLQPSSGSIEAG
jgi:lipopolysaccharide/colanic/teichoic acid biosynthesis glycosyltransferase